MLIEKTLAEGQHQSTKERFSEYLYLVNNFVILEEILKSDWIKNVKE